jgi:hypothetical protein
VPATFAAAVAADVPAGAGAAAGVALADDEGDDAWFDEAEDEGDCEQAVSPAAPAKNTQPARTDLRTVEDMEHPSHRGTDGQLYAFSPAAASPVRQGAAAIPREPWP